MTREHDDLGGTRSRGEDKLLELDDRRRTSLGRIGRPQDRRYVVSELPDGTVILRPAVVLTEAELKLLSDPERLARVDAALADPDAAVPWTPRTPRSRADAS